MPTDPPAPFAPGATRRNHVRVGVGVVVQDPTTSKLFAGIRKGSHGAGTLALPGGHLELYESWDDCARREVREEMNLELSSDDMQLGHVTNDPMPDENKHYVTIFMLAKAVDVGKLENMEPDKCEGWQAYTWAELCAMPREQLFGPLRRLVEQNPESVRKFLGEE